LNFKSRPGIKALNPVVRDSGKFIAFQMAKSRESAGVGNVIVVYDIEMAKKAKPCVSQISSIPDGRNQIHGTGRPHRTNSGQSFDCS